MERDSCNFDEGTSRLCNDNDNRFKDTSLSEFYSMSSNLEVPRTCVTCSSAYLLLTKTDLSTEVACVESEVEPPTRLEEPMRSPAKVKAKAWVASRMGDLEAQNG